MSERLQILLAVWGVMAVFTLMGFATFWDRPDLRSLAWVPNLFAALVATPIILLADLS